MKTYYIEAARHEKNEYRVECSQFKEEEYHNDQLPAYHKMVDWMKEQLSVSEDGKIRVHKLTPEYDPSRDMNITSHETTRTGPNYRVIPDYEIILDADEPFQEVKPEIPYEAKGYDLFEDAYFFATVDTLRTVKPYQAESPEQALQMAKGDQLHNVLTKVQPIRQFLHADKYERVTLQSGQTIGIVSDEDFQQRLREKFPDGLTIRLADENYARLAYFKNSADNLTADMDDWMGLANPGNTKMLVAHGEIPAELKLKPEDYKYIFACEDTYYDKDLMNLLEDDSLTAASLLLAQELEMKAMRVKVSQVPVMMDRLFIAGKPFKTIMEMASDFKVKNDRDFRSMLNKIYLHDQPEWLKQLANVQTQERRHKAFINMTAGAAAEHHREGNRLLEDAAKSVGCTVDDLQKYMKQPSNVPYNLKDKVIQAVTTYHREMQPYEQKLGQAYERYGQAVNSLEAEFVHKFNDFIKNHVNEVTMYPNNQGKWNVRCKIDGEQQMGRQITDSDARIRKESNGNFQSIKLMACKYFKDEIVSAMTTGQEQQQSKSLHR